MKAFLLFLLLPFFVQAQTIHRKGDKIIYEGEVPLPGHSGPDVYAQLQTAAAKFVKKGKSPATLQANGHDLVALADMQLKTAYSLVRTVNYTVQFTAKDGGYAYRIDSVYVIDKKRDGNEEKQSAKELLQKMEVSGPVAEAAEKLLNEIDMNFQMLLALMKNKMQNKNGNKQ